MVPPFFITPFCSSIRWIRGFSQSALNSLEKASLSPQTFLPYSTTAICIPRQIPKKGTFLVRANSIALIFPSVPRSPNPPGTRIPSTSVKATSTPSCSIFSDYGNLHFAMGRLPEFLNHALPGGKIRRFCPDIELLHDLIVQTLLVQRLRDGINVICVRRGDNRFLVDIAEERDLAFKLPRHLLFAAAEEDIGLDAYLLKLLHGVLRRLALQLAGGLDVRDERQMDV